MNPRPARFLTVFFLGAGVVVGREVITARRNSLKLDPPPSSGTIELGRKDHSHIHLVVLGDSTAVGVGANRIEETYPWRVAKFLASEFRVRLDVVGRSGARMKDLSSDFVPRASELRPDLALIGIGANDVVHGTSMRTVARHLDLALQTLARSGCEVLVALGPRFDPPILKGLLRRLVKARARALNRTIRRVAQRRSVTIIDLPGGVGSSFADEPDRYYSQDRYHPGPEGYKLWADILRAPLLDAARYHLSSPLARRRNGDPERVRGNS